MLLLLLLPAHTLVIWCMLGTEAASVTLCTAAMVAHSPSKMCGAYTGSLCWARY